MKAEKSSHPPKFNLTKIDGQVPQRDADVISKVYLTSGATFDIVPGSFHFYTTPGDRPVPFIQFESKIWNENSELCSHIVEVFPASVAGIAYLKPTDNE